MVAERAWRITCAMAAKVQPAIGAQGIQEQVEAWINVRVVNKRQVNQELGNITLRRNLVSSKPTETIRTRESLAGGIFRHTSEMLDSVGGDLLELLARHVVFECSNVSLTGRGDR
jgi:hypothetical protein